MEDTTEDLGCRFCSSPAVAIFTMTEGCLCYPDDRQQALCMQHILRATPLGTMDLEEDLTVGNEFTTWWEAGFR